MLGPGLHLPPEPTCPCGNKAHSSQHGPAQGTAVLSYPRPPPGPWHLQFPLPAALPRLLSGSPSPCSHRLRSTKTTGGPQTLSPLPRTQDMCLVWLPLQAESSTAGLAVRQWHWEKPGGLGTGGQTGWERGASVL